jgi:polyisoprenoid-binding protein YceI
VSGVDAGEPDATIDVALMLHGTTRTLRVPARLEAGTDRMTVTGTLSFDQTDFGITPYSVLGGAIAVRNRVDLRFRIEALRVRESGQ